jgi:5'-nucleotidase
MPKKRLLLTGDDGYNSIGTRLLIRALQDDFSLQVAATKHQQSGVGGQMSLEKGGEWGETEVDGVPVFWVDGSPVDAMECAQAYFSQPFDLIISGVNMGPNASSATISSGTYSAAVRGMGVGLAPRALAMSWDAPASFWFRKHDANEDISSYFKYPGDVLRPLISLILREDLWGAPLLNINLPQQASNTIRFTKILKDITRYFTYPITVDPATHHFSYDRKPINILEKNLRYDVAAMAQGHISITPCAFDMTHFSTFARLENNEMELSV